MEPASHGTLQSATHDNDAVVEHRVARDACVTCDFSVRLDFGWRISLKARMPKRVGTRKQLSGVLGINSGSRVFQKAVALKAVLQRRHKLLLNEWPVIPQSARSDNWTTSRSRLLQRYALVANRWHGTVRAITLGSAVSEIKKQRNRWSARRRERQLPSCYCCPCAY